MLTELRALRDAMADIAGVLSAKIGYEDGISPADFPLVRLVPERISAGKPYGKRTAEVQIWFGVPVAGSEGLEAVYAALLGLEADVRGVLAAQDCRYIETLTDRDELQAPYKLMAVRCEVPGV